MNDSEHPAVDSSLGNFTGFNLTNDGNTKDSSGLNRPVSKSTADFKDDSGRLDDSGNFGSNGIQNQSRNSSRFEDEDDDDDDAMGFDSRGQMEISVGAMQKKNESMNIMTNDSLAKGQTSMN